MAYQRVPETVEVSVVFRNIGREVMNLYYAKKVGGYSQADIDGLAAAVDNVAPNFATIISLDDAYLRTDVRGLDSENDIVTTVNTSATSGSIASQPLPSNVSFVVTQRSGLTGRNAQGRVYCCCLPVAALAAEPYGNEDRLDATHAAAWVGVVDAVRMAIENFGTWDPVLVSRYYQGAKRATAVTFPWISSDARTNRVATRRRRLT